MESKEEEEERGGFAYVMRMAARDWKKLAPKTTRLLTPEPTRVKERRPVTTAREAKMRATR